MARKREVLYNTQIFMDDLLVGWVSEISYEFDYENQQKTTHSGRMTMNSPYPGVEVSMTKLTKCEVIDENRWLDVVDKASIEGVTITMISKMPKGTVVVSAYRCRPDSEEWSNEAAEFMEIEGSYQGEDFERYFIKNGALTN